jgi:hypothetical protein
MDQLASRGKKWPRISLRTGAVLAAVQSQENSENPAIICQHILKSAGKTLQFANEIEVLATEPPPTL